MPLYIPFSRQQLGTWRGGQVHEIFRDPPEADYPNGAYRLWVGTATIERAADYSHFAHAERLHILLHGGGLALHFREPTETFPLATGNWRIFAGDRPLHAVPIDGPVFAFNLIYRQAQRSGAESGAAFVGAGEMPIALPVSVAAGASQTQIVYALAGQAAVECQGEIHLLQTGDTLVFQLNGPASDTLRLTTNDPEARLLVAHVLAPPVYSTTSA